MTIDDRARRAARDFRDAAERSTFGRPSISRFDRYRSRRQRSQRISAAAMAIVISVGALIVAVRTLDAPDDETPAGPVPPTGLIVFNETYEDGVSERFDSFTVRSDGSELTRIGPPGTTVCSGNGDTWSPDGKAMLCQVFLSDLSTATAIMNADGSGYSIIANPDLPGRFGCSAWSPDGTRLFCPYTPDVVYTIKPDGSGLLALTTTSASSGPSGYTGDGAHAYYAVQDASGLRTLYAVTTDGKGEPTAVSPEGVSVQDNDYFDGVSADSSPDGSRMVFAADVSSAAKSLFVVNIDGSRPRRIDTPGVNPTSAQWSAAEDWIAFAAYAATSQRDSEVYLIHPDGTGLRQISSSSDGCSSYAPVWSADGEAVLFETQCYDGSAIVSTRLELAAIDGAGVWKVADLAGLTSYAWRPAP
jgi:Tol biopolymer transport system component